MNLNTGVCQDKTFFGLFGLSGFRCTNQGPWLLYCTVLLKYPDVKWVFGRKIQAGSSREIPIEKPVSVIIMSLFGNFGLSRCRRKENFYDSFRNVFLRNVFETLLQEDRSRKIWRNMKRPVLVFSKYQDSDKIKKSIIFVTTIFHKYKVVDWNLNGASQSKKYWQIWICQPREDKINTIFCTFETIRIPKEGTISISSLLISAPQVKKCRLNFWFSNYEFETEI